MLTCYIIDDELHAIKTLSSYIEKTPLLQLTGSSENPLEALAYFQEVEQLPDITFVDIDMPQITGIELSSLIKEKTAVVFTTAHPNFALQAFEMDIKDYLLKPFSYSRFLKCITKLQEQLSLKKDKTRPPNDPFFYIQTEGKGKLIKLLLQDIFYIESQRNYISFITAEKRYLTYLTLNEVEEKLSDTFIRINKSNMINKDKISHVEGSEVFLVNWKEGFTIGVNYKDAFSTYMNEHLIKTKRYPG